MKRFFAVILAVLILCIPALASAEDSLNIPAPSAILMEKTTGQVLWEKNSHERLAPASVTKVMTMLLTVEAIEAQIIQPETVVTASEHAASMGGSQIWLEAGERMTVSEMLKCVAVVSANDCAVALAELLAGSEDAFAAKMNERAEELGMNDTHFVNCTGLGEHNDHYTTAYDIALMSRELVKHEMIRDYTTVWTDTIRDGEFGLSNTNKLIRYYEGATGLKTGFTSQAMYCLSATAERDGVEYIAVILHAETSQERFDGAKTLLSYAFANYTVVSLRPSEVLPPVAVELGAADAVQPVYNGPETLLSKKGGGGELSYDVSLEEKLTAPVCEGDVLGLLTVTKDGTVISEIPIVAGENVARMSFFNIYCHMAGIFVGK